MIPDRIRRKPKTALKDPYFSTQEGIYEYLYTFNDWTFSLPDALIREAGDVAVVLARGQDLAHQAEAQKCKGTGYRRLDMNITRKAYERALTLYQRAPPNQKGLADLFRRIGILEGEQGRWTQSDQAHHICAALLEKQDRQSKAIALSTWGASKLARAFKEGHQHLFVSAADILAAGIRKMNREPKEPMISALGNLINAEMMAGFPVERLEQTFLALQEARCAKSTQARGKIRTKLSWGLKIHRVKFDEVDLHICWAQAYLIIRQQRFAVAADGLRKIRQGFETIGLDHAASEVALDEALVLALLGEWQKAGQLLAGSAKLLDDERVALVAAAIEAHEIRSLAASLVDFSWNESRRKNPAVIAAGF